MANKIGQPSRKRKSRRGKFLKKWWESQRKKKNNDVVLQSSEASSCGVASSDTSAFLLPSATTSDIKATTSETSFMLSGNEAVSSTPTLPSPATPVSSQPELEPPLSGRRIVNLQHLWNQFQKIACHGPLDCGAGCLVLESEQRHGFLSTLRFSCMMCKKKFIVTSDPGQGMDINFAVVMGTMAIGAGFSQLEEFTSAVNIPCMSYKTYTESHKKVGEAWHQAALDEMKKAAAEERKLAIENGDIHEDKVPFITVVVDGAWSKRSYKNKYNALSGVASIIGYKTKKVLYTSVRNKYCTICARAANKKMKPREHCCNKNWDGPSTAMEADIILEGFQKSEELYGLRYTTFIGDGDSSAYRVIKNARPYGVHEIHKIECRNHILRNYSNKLRNDLYVPKRDSATRDLRCAVKHQENRLHTAVVGAINHHSTQQGPLESRIHNLRHDILNSPNHVFGDHSECASYFCDGPSRDIINTIPLLKESGVYDDLMKIVSHVADHAPSLIHNVNSNVVEHFNAVVAKFVGGKRINFSLRDSYRTRCYGAVVSFNSSDLFSATWRIAFSASPGLYTKKFCMRRGKREESCRKRKREPRHFASNKRKRLNFVCPEGDEHYGPFADQPVSSQHSENVLPS